MCGCLSYRYPPACAASLWFCGGAVGALRSGRRKKVKKIERRDACQLSMLFCILTSLFGDRSELTVYLLPALAPVSSPLSLINTHTYVHNSPRPTQAHAHTHTSCPHSVFVCVCINAPAAPRERCQRPPSLPLTLSPYLFFPPLNAHARTCMKKRHAKPSTTREALVCVWHKDAVASADWASSA